MTSNRAVEPQDGWEELRREIEALKADRGDAEWDTVARQEVLAIVDRLAAARGEPGLDVERLRAAIIKASEYIAPAGHGHGPRLMRRNVPIKAEEVATAYDRLGE